MKQTIKIRVFDTDQVHTEQVVEKIKEALEGEGKISIQMGNQRWEPINQKWEEPRHEADLSNSPTLHS